MVLKHVVQFQKVEIAYLLLVQMFAVGEVPEEVVLLLITGLLLDQTEFPENIVKIVIEIVYCVNYTLISQHCASSQSKNNSAVKQR